MKTIGKVIKYISLAPFKLIHKTLVFILEVISTLILLVGSIIYGIAYFIKSPKVAMIVVRTAIKKIISNGTI